MKGLWALGIALASALALGPAVIPLLRKMKFGQSIRDEGPQSHMVKSGTPTMGGVIFAVSALAANLVLWNINWESALLLTGFLGYGLIGFVDDYIKVIMKRNLGLKAWQKIAGQLLVSIAVALMGMVNGTDVYIPLFNIYFDLGFLYIPFVVFVLVAITNSVNLTDGLDGLAGGVTAIVMMFFAAVAWKLNMESAMIFAMSMTGGLLGFLYFNKYPAKVFMGDTGSLALGGALGALSILTKMEFMLVFAGIIYVLESLSVIIQVGSFKLTGKRVFRMSPLHHHFELSGWKETRVVLTFWSVTLLACCLSYFIIM